MRPLHPLAAALAALLLALPVAGLVHTLSAVLMAEPWPFLRATSRVAGLFALGLVFIYRRREGTWKTLGFGGPKYLPRDFAAGFACGLAGFVGLIALFGAATGEAAWVKPEGVAFLLRRAGEALVAALAVAFLEEIFFRGYLVGAFARCDAAEGVGPSRAALLSSVFYSAVHFLRTPPFPALAAEAAGLFFLGLALSHLFLATGRLYAPMGFHAAVVFGMKTKDVLWTWEVDRPIAAPLAWLLLLVASAVAARAAAPAER